jgi:hypothetical protein
MKYFITEKFQLDWKKKKKKLQSYRQSDLATHPAVPKLGSIIQR